MSPRAYNRTLRKAAAEEAKRRIVEAAAGLHAAHGGLGTSHAMIAKRAGVSIPTVYKYFPTGNDLIPACTGLVASRAPVALDERIFDGLPRVADRVRALHEIARVLDRAGALYLHTPSRWSCFESHYKLLWLPGSPRWLSRAYLAARGRPSAFLDTLSLTTAGECARVLAAAGMRTIRVLEGDRSRRVGGPLWPLVRLYYRVFRVRPSVELVATR